MAQSHDTFFQRHMSVKVKKDQMDQERLEYYSKQCFQEAQPASEDEGCDVADPATPEAACTSLSGKKCLTSPARQEVAANSQLWMEDEGEQEEDEELLPAIQRAFDPFSEDLSKEKDTVEHVYDHAAAMRDWRALWVDGTMDFEAEDSTDEEEGEPEGEESLGHEFMYSHKPSTSNSYTLAKCDLEELDSYWERAESLAEEALPPAQHAHDPFGKYTDDGFDIEEEDLPMFQHPFDPFNVHDDYFAAPDTQEPSWPLKLGDLGGCGEPNELENEGCPPPEFPPSVVEENSYDSDEEWKAEEMLPRIVIPKIQVFGETEGHSPLGPFSPYEAEFMDDPQVPQELWDFPDEEQEGEDCRVECYQEQSCDMQTVVEQDPADNIPMWGSSRSSTADFNSTDDYRSIPNLGSEQDDAPLLLKTYSNRSLETTPSPPGTPMILKSLHGFFEDDDFEDCELPAAQEPFDPFNHLKYGWAPLPDEDRTNVTDVPKNPPSAAQVATAQNGKLMPPPPPPEAIAEALQRGLGKEEVCGERPIKCIVQFGYASGSIKTLGLNEGLDSTVGALKELAAELRGVESASLRASRAGIELQDWNVIEHLDFVHITQHHC